MSKARAKKVGTKIVTDCVLNCRHIVCDKTRLYCGLTVGRRGRELKDVREIPSWCPLPDAEEESK